MFCTIMDPRPLRPLVLLPPFLLVVGGFPSVMCKCGVRQIKDLFLLSNSCSAFPVSCPLLACHSVTPCPPLLTSSTTPPPFFSPRSRTWMWFISIHSRNFNLSKVKHRLMGGGRKQKKVVNVTRNLPHTFFVTHCLLPLLLLCMMDLSSIPGCRSNLFLGLPPIGR